MCHVGLRVDVDTLRGTCIGVPNLVDLLARHQIRASFFFSVGPDNMGRHLWRLMRPAFLLKMFRTRAVRLYGWDILFRGTLWPGAVIGKRCSGPIRQVVEAGHEVGLHAWDHHRWQTAIEKMDKAEIITEIRKGCELLTDILGHAPECFAAPAWKVTLEALSALEQFPFRFESDCRGRSLFYPLMHNRPSRHVQVPTTLPTYDELVGRQCTPETYNDHLLNMIRPDQLNVLTIHAEVEGGACLELFRNFLLKAQQREIAFAPLGDILGETGKAEKSRVVRGTFAGRDGWLACQDGAHSMQIHDKVSKR